MKTKEQIKKTPMGVSQWREYGKKYGYWDYFKKEVIEECREKLLKDRNLAYREEEIGYILNSLNKLK